jgi:biopolymer transport protein ExbD
MHWVKLMKLRSSERQDPDINLTSLIDVVLLLLIFFMISTSFVSESKIGIRLPEASATTDAADTKDPLVIAVTAQGSYRVNDRALLDDRPETLEDAIRELAGNYPGTRITISADAQAAHQSVITAMDIAGRLGYIEINIATVKAKAD